MQYEHQKKALKEQKEMVKSSLIDSFKIKLDKLWEVIEGRAEESCNKLWKWADMICPDQSFFSFIEGILWM